MAASKYIKSLQDFSDQLSVEINHDIERLLELVPEHKREDAEFLITMIQYNSTHRGRVKYVIEKSYLMRLCECEKEE